MQEELEHAEAVIEEPIPQDVSEGTSEGSEGISEIFANALTGQGEPTKEDAGDNDIKEKENLTIPESSNQETEDVKGIKPYGDVTFAGKKLLTLKTDKDFKDFIESNPVLKDKILMRADYTQKTQALSEDRRKFEEERKKAEVEKVQDDESWGMTKPQKEDLQAFKTLWHVFQHASDPVANKIAGFFNDIAAIASGKNPTGPLLGNQDEKIDYSSDSRIIGLQRQFESYKMEQDRKEKELQAEKSVHDQEKANSLVNSWIDSKKKEGLELTKDELLKMAELSRSVNVDHKTFTLDDLYRLATIKLGKTDKSVMQKVVKTVEQKSKSTPRAPMSRTSSNSQPDADSLDDILTEGIRNLKGE